MLTRTWMFRLAAAAGCATVLMALADEDAPRPVVRRLTLLSQQPAEEEADVERRRGPEGRSSHWLGLECFPIDAALRSHLGLAEGEGLIIEQVVPESPAAKAELK